MRWNMFSPAGRRMNISSLPAVATSTINQNHLSAAAGVVVVPAIIAALYFGRDILIPISLSVLLSVALIPLVRPGQLMGLGRVRAAERRYQFSSLTFVARLV